MVRRKLERSEHYVTHAGPFSIVSFHSVTPHDECFGSQAHLGRKSQEISMCWNPAANAACLALYKQSGAFSAQSHAYFLLGNFCGLGTPKFLDQCRFQHGRSIGFWRYVINNHMLPFVLRVLVTIYIIPPPPGRGMGIAQLENYWGIFSKHGFHNTNRMTENITCQSIKFWKLKSDGVRRGCLNQRWSDWGLGRSSCGKTSHHLGPPSYVLEVSKVFSPEQSSCFPTLSLRVFADTKRQANGPIILLSCNQQRCFVSFFPWQ